MGGTKFWFFIFQCRVAVAWFFVKFERRLMNLGFETLEGITFKRLTEQWVMWSLEVSSIMASFGIGKRQRIYVS